MRSIVSPRPVVSDSCSCGCADVTVAPGRALVALSRASLSLQQRHASGCFVATVLTRCSVGHVTSLVLKSTVPFAATIVSESAGRRNSLPLKATK